MFPTDFLSTTGVPCLIAPMVALRLCYWILRVVVIGPWVVLMDRANLHIAPLSRLCLIASCFLMFHFEIQGLILRCHLPKVLKVPLANIVLINCLGIKESSICILFQCAVFYPHWLQTELSKTDPREQPREGLSSRMDRDLAGTLGTLSSQGAPVLQFCFLWDPGDVLRTYRRQKREWFQGLPMARAWERTRRCPLRTIGKHRRLRRLSSCLPYLSTSHL